MVRKSKVEFSVLVIHPRGRPSGYSDEFDKVLKSFFKKFLTFFSKEDSKKGEGKKRISYTKMEEFCKLPKKFHC